MSNVECRRNARPPKQGEPGASASGFLERASSIHKSLQSYDLAKPAGEMFGLCSTLVRTIFAPVSAKVRPAFGRFSARVRGMFDWLTANFRPMFDSLSGDVRVVFDSLSANLRSSFDRDSINICLWMGRGSGGSVEAAFSRQRSAFSHSRRITSAGPAVVDRRLLSTLSGTPAPASGYWPLAARDSPLATNHSCFNCQRACAWAWRNTSV